MSTKAKLKFPCNPYRKIIYIEVNMAQGIVLCGRGNRTEKAEHTRSLHIRDGGLASQTAVSRPVLPAIQQSR